VASSSSLTEVAAPDGQLYLIGPGGFARHDGGPFSIVGYPFGQTQLAFLRSRPSYVEGISRADAVAGRLEELTNRIRDGTWTPPALAETERARLETRAVKRNAQRQWAQLHPVASIVKATANMAVVVLVFVGIGVLSDLIFGRGVQLPSPLPLLAFVAGWAALLCALAVWNARHLARPD
jgi:hypothetical protein